MFAPGASKGRFVSIGRFRDARRQPARQETIVVARNTINVEFSLIVISAKPKFP
jgi:hypothetical protein